MARIAAARRPGSPRSSPSLRMITTVFGPRRRAACSATNVSRHSPMRVPPDQSGTRSARRAGAGGGGPAAGGGRGGADGARGPRQESLHLRQLGGRTQLERLALEARLRAPAEGDAGGIAGAPLAGGRRQAERERLAARSLRARRRAAALAA